MPQLRVIFFGTAPLACPSLAALVKQPEVLLNAVVTQPDRPKGRELRLQPPAVKSEALVHRLPVLQPERARNPEFIQQLARLEPELIVVAAYGQILPQSILDLPRLGCVNVHASLLPKYRGAAPIQWALLNDEPETGVTLMKMDAGLDTGAILAVEKTAILPEDNAQTLHDRLARLGADLLLRTLPDYVSGRIQPRPQPEQGASYARKITREDGLLDWRQPARALWSRVRGLIPWPGAFTYLPGAANQPLLKIWRAEVCDAPGGPGEILQADPSGILVACGAGSLLLLEIQREGGRRLTAREFLAGHSLRVGDRFEPAQAK
jgi:methionyl-tRNA formyltransferase